MIRLAGCCTLVFPLSFLACAPRATSPAGSASRAGSGIFHVVQPGENLFRIGKAYDTTSAELARVNGIRDPRQIAVGQKIFIPGATRQIPVEIVTPAENTAMPRSGTGERVFLWPVSGSLNSGFGPRGSSFHDGVDIAAPEGTPIRAVEHGEVIFSDQLRGYGNIIIIRHSGGMVSVYAHNQVNLVRDGRQVARGEIIGRVGSTGRVTGPHLHFEIRKNNLAQDPMLYLPQLCCVPASDMVAPNG
ncbi:MAG TPA: LysM peptidoglycan-binding domain-containing M23 family metallopeptidase [Candidatus Binatia bacterium]|nr:LysM peptidoglycan-binding domain-containing M23 family metallopeptidase [Candidatus Binatia bacterium]